MATLIGVVSGALIGALVDPTYGPLGGWDTAVVAYMTWVWLTVWPLDGDETAALAELEDPTRPTADLLLLVAAVASLGAVALLLSRASAGSRDASLVAVVGLVSVIASWALVHTVYALGYARRYYAGEDGGVEFPGAGRPSYGDFAYLSFTIGMTFQVSDTDIHDPGLRRVVLRHGLISFVFATGILATTINLVANLTSGG
jgi:uncharacterized membrane protein